MTKQQSDGLYGLIEEWREWANYNLENRNEERGQALNDCANDLLELIENGFKLLAYDND